MLLLGPGKRRVLIIGNEGMGYTPLAGLILEVGLCQSFSRMGQDRSRAPRLDQILRNAGIHTGQRVAVAGWKYLEVFETV